MEVFILNGRIAYHSQLNELTENRLSSAQTYIQDYRTECSGEKQRNCFAHLLLQDADAVGL